MKHTPKRHKTSNTFKFQKFSERISQIDINVFHKVKHPYEEENEEDGTYYFRRLEWLINDNFSPEFSELCKELPRDVYSLPQLIAQQHNIVNLLIRHIKSCDLEALPPALELLVAIAQDLRKEFYQFFHPLILRECVILLDTREPEQIECVFSSLAHFFKYLWAPIAKNINLVLPDFLPLLSSSKPKYINEFAAESFAFVARKVKDKKSFVKLSLKNVKKNQDELVGVARLFLEVIKSVGQQFHSCTEDFLTLLLEELDDRRWSEILLIICENLMSDITRFVSAKTDVSIIWKSLMNVGKKFAAMWIENRIEHNASNLFMILKIAETLISSREVILRNPEEFMSFLLLLGKDPETRKFSQLHEIIIDIVAYILNHEHLSRKIQNTSDIIIKIIENIEDEVLLVRFCEKLIQRPQFESLVFKEFLKLFQTKCLNKFLIQFLVKIIWMKTKFSVAENSNLQFFFACLKSVPDSFNQYLLDCIPDKSKKITSSSVEEILYAIFILSGVEKCRSSFCKKVDRAIVQMCKIIDDGNEEHVAKILYSLFMACQYRLTCDVSLQFSLDLITTTAVKYVNSCNFLCSLQLLHLNSSEIDLKSIYSQKLLLINNLSSPFHKVRLLTLQVLAKMEIHEVFETMLNVESIIPSIENYREKLYLLQKLEYNEQFASCEDFVAVAVLKFLFGNLYINFQYLWEPTQKLIRSHLENCQPIWPTMEHQLSEAVTNTLNSIKLMENFSVNFEGEIIHEHFYDVNGVDNRPDFYNFRCLLLETVLDAKSVQFTSKRFALDLFLNFMKSEYKNNVFEYKTLINIKKMEEGLDTDDDDTDNAAPKSKHEQKLKPDPNLNKLLVLFLKLMNNFPFLIPQNVRSEVLEIYFDLLTNKNSEVQQLAVAYICKSRTMSIYKERLQLLTKENTLKDQLLNVKLDMNSDILPEQDKPQIMKIVLKILYGKVKRKCSPQMRDSVFEFLAGCDDSYIVSFFDLFFSCKQFKAAVNDSSSPLLYLSEEVDLESTISPSCLSSYATTVVDLFNRCGKLLKPRCLTYLLRVLFKIMANWRIVSAARAEVHRGYYNLLNKIRVTSFAAMSYFIDNFQYEWSKDEMEVLLQLFVDPWLEKIPEECLQSPNQALRLLIIFTNNTRYFPILARKSETTSPLDVIVHLLDSDKTYFNVKNTALEIIERLLTLEGDIKERSQVSSAKIDLQEFSDLFYLLDEEFIESYKREKHFGKILVQPHIPTVLKFLQQQLSKKFVKLNSMYMLILQNISTFALDEASSCRLLDLLMPTLRNKATADDDVVLPLLQVISDLFKTFHNGNNFEKYLLQVGQLFNTVNSGVVRNALCDLVKYISSKTGPQLVDGDLVRGLNLNDSRWLDQPDYAGRLETLKKIKTSCEVGELSLYSGVFIVYNCFYTVKTEKDMGLRDHAGLCLKRICPAMCTKLADSPNELNFFLNTVLLPLIKDGIESKHENYQLESILLLGHLVRECSSSHFVFKNLFPLCDRNNLDNDFFENIYHLQNFRRIKAVKRFNEVMSQEEKPMQPYSLMFLHPLISQYLLSPKFSTEHSLINNAVEALKIICHFCPWRQYEKILKLYILEMRKNVALRKQAIRIVSTILDAFHFDISQADDDDFEKAPAPRAKKGGQNEGSDEDEEPMEVDEVDSEKADKQRVPVVKRINVLCRSDAVRVYRTIKTFLIPSLDNAFRVYEDAEKYHKLSKSNSNDNQEELAVMSIPVSFAAIKLLKRLPPALLESYIPRVFLKLSTYLRSRLPSIRMIAKETLQNILLEVGPTYLPRLLSEMTSILTKGFQVHVLVFTSHAVLEKLESTFTKGVIDPCIDRILEICIVDLFGKVAEEKEVEKISSKIPETKGNISYNMLRILAEYASVNHILDLVLPFKEIIASNMSSKKVTKVSRCLHYITTGLTHNKFISAEDLLVFSYGVSHDCIPMLVAERENNTVQVGPEVPFERPDSLLIPEEPRHMVAEKRNICIRTNAHVIIAFGLEILSVLLKRETIVSATYLPHLDPFVPLINDCLQSQHTELIVLALKCLSRLLLRDLPSMKDNVENILDSVFTLLGKYSLSGTTTKNEELVMAATKVTQVLMQPKLKTKIPSAQLQILLYVVEDLLKNRTHYATGYSILGTIIGRRFDTSEFHELMRTTAKFSIQSYHDDMRYKAQDALCRYMMYYAPSKKYRHFIEFYVSQLEYAEQFGRKSALEMFKKLIEGILSMEQKMPNSAKKEMYESRLNVIKTAFLDLCPIIFVQLSFRLIVDDSPECKKMSANLISDIISFTSGRKEGNDLFDITLAWLKDKKIRDRRLAVQLFGLFVTVQKEKFASHLNTLLPLMTEQFYANSFDGPGKYIRVAVVEKSPEEEADRDHLCFQVLQFYSTVFSVYPTFLTNEEYAEHIWKIGENCQTFLGHEHEWVRLEAARVLVAIFKSMEPARIASVINGKLPHQPRFLHDENVKPVIRGLCLDLCDQLAPGADVREELLKAAVVNLIFLAEVLQDVKYQSGDEKLSLRWLMQRISKQCALEVIRSPFKYSVRNIVFNYFAALAKKLRPEKLTKVLTIIMLPLLRELSITDEQGVDIRRVAKEVLSYFRPLEQYDQAVSEVQRTLDIRRAKRKSQAAQMNITDPERAAGRKIKIQLKKKEQRKRRLEKIRKRKFRSGKKKPVVIDDD